MKNYIVKFIVFILFPLSMFAQSQIPINPDAKSFKVQQEYKQKLRFQKVWDNYLIFYDNDHQLYYLKYRLDRWDYHNDEIIKDFFSSVEYLVALRYAGFAVSEKELVKQARTEEKIQNKHNIREVKKIIYGDFISYKNIQVDLIRY